jgi:hypothetical protein
MKGKKFKMLLANLGVAVVLMHAAASCEFRDLEHYDFGFFDVYVAEDDDHDFFDVLVDF